MAVENKIATGAADTDVVTQTGHARSLKFKSTTVEVSNAGSVGSTYMIGRVPSGARLSRSRLYWDAMGGTATLNLGVSGPSFPLNDLILNDSLVFSAAGPGVSFVKDIVNYAKPLYELVGLLNDPNEVWSIQAVIRTAAVGAGGTLTAEFIYTPD